MANQSGSHQTVRLSRGKHRSPEDGACVMELASMLAGEEFTDSPKSVCPVLASFMRTYNDLVDDSSRQDLYGFAARAVGTADDGQSVRRGQLCADLVRTLRGGWWSALDRHLRLGGWGHAAAATDAAKELAKATEYHLAALVVLAALVGIDELDLELALVTAHPSHNTTTGGPWSSSASL